MAKNTFSLDELKAIPRSTPVNAVPSAKAPAPAPAAEVATAPASTDSAPPAAPTQVPTDSADQPSVDAVASPADQPADSATAAPDSADQPSTDAPAGETPRAPRTAREKTEDRVADLLAERHALRQYGEHQARVIEQLVAQQRPQPPAVAPATAAPAAAPAATDDPAPTLDQHEYDTAKWAKAHADWSQRQIDKRVAAAIDAQQAKQAAQVTQQAFISRVAEFRKTAADFDVVVSNPALPGLSPAAAGLIVQSEMGPQITYHLAKNPDIATRISRMAPEQQAMAIGRIEGQLTAVRATPPAATARSATPSTTKAPPPPAVTRSAASAALPADPSKMTMEQFVEHSKREAAAKRERLRSRR